MPLLIFQESAVDLGIRCRVLLQGVFSDLDADIADRGIRCRGELPTGFRRDAQPVARIQRDGFAVQNGLTLAGKDHIDFFEQVPEYDVSLYTHKKMKTDAASSLAVLQDVLPLLKENSDYSNDGLFGLLSDYAAKKEYKTGFVMWPIRTALSGKQMTPGGATELMEILGRDESLKRIEDAIEKLS